MRGKNAACAGLHASRPVFLPPSVNRGGGTCECYWVEVDTYDSVDKALLWNERVVRTAEVAARDFVALQERFDFLAGGRKAFPGYLDTLLADGRDPADATCFVWCVLREDGASANGL